MYVLTAENVRNLELFAVRERGMTNYAMMDMAGRKCGDYIAARTDPGARVALLCGKGKNGGDVLVCARHLWQKGFRHVCVILVFGDVTDNLSYRMMTAAENYPITVVKQTENPMGALHVISHADVIVDGIFGIGFSGQLTGNAADAVQTANMNQKAVKYAIDVPSGLYADSNEVPPLYYRADVTLTMFTFKPVQVNKPTSLLCGKTEVIDLGLLAQDPAQFAEPYRVLTDNEAYAMVRHREYGDHKGMYGKILIISGSRNMTGCAVLQARAAVEIGAGLVRMAYPDAAYAAIAPNLAETTSLPLPSDANGAFAPAAADALAGPLDWAQGVALGSGIGTGEGARAIVRRVLKDCRVPLVLDADGLNCLALEGVDLLKQAQCPVIVTPHKIEMTRLTGKTAEEIQSDRKGVALEFAKTYGVIVVLKGAHTLIAMPDGSLFVNITGNPGMARGGSGDVLTGMIAGLIGQTKSPCDAACVGCMLHGSAADFVAAKTGLLSVTPSRLIENLHESIMQTEKVYN